MPQNQVPLLYRRCRFVWYDRSHNPCVILSRNWWNSWVHKSWFDQHFLARGRTDACPPSRHGLKKKKTEKPNKKNNNKKKEERRRPPTESSSSSPMRCAAAVVVIGFMTAQRWAQRRIALPFCASSSKCWSHHEHQLKSNATISLDGLSIISSIISGYLVPFIRIHKIMKSQCDFIGLGIQ